MNRYLQFNKKFKLVLLLLLSVVGMERGYASYDFVVFCETGQALYYKITDATNHYVKVSFPSNDASYPWNGIMKPSGAVIVPSVVANEGVEYTVSSIGMSAFYTCSGLTSIEIPNSVSIIDNNAFRDCTGLTSVSLGNSVSSIGDYAFKGCSGLTSVVLPNSITIIGNDAFSGCSKLTAIEIPDSVISIGNFAFAGCSKITSAILGNSLTTLGNYTFSGCSKLASISLGNSLTTLGNYAFFNCTALTSIELPNSITTIGDNVFDHCNGMSSVIIGNSVTSIGSRAFYYCNKLTSVEIPNSVFSIGNGAFEDCGQLTNVIIGNSVVSIGASTFHSCSELASVILGNSLTSIGGFAFANCSGLTSIEIPNTVTSIGENAFSGCSGLTSLTIPNSVTFIGDMAFSGCIGIEHLLVNSENTVYDSRDDCDAIIKSSTNELVAGCKNTVIPTTAISIGYAAFYGCSSLTSIEIPSSVTTLGSYSFSECSGLTSMTVLSDTPVLLGTNVFRSVPKSIPVYVPCSSKNAYQTAEGWGAFTNYHGIDEYSISVSTNNDEGGLVVGGGNYCSGENCILSATANEGYTFLNWTENGEVISTDAEYTFMVTGERTLVANFTAIPPYFTLESLSNNNTITFNIPSEITSEQLTSVSYSTDGTNWTTLTVNSTDQSICVTLNIGEKMYFKGVGIQYGYEDEDEAEMYYCHISATGDFNAFGNTMSLLYGDNFASLTEFNYDSDATFYGLFKGNTHLVSAENLQLPAIDLPYKCYEVMFEGCSSLTTAPELPATSLGPHCYGSMFKGCSSLITPPELPATNVYQWAYYYMFSGCTSLTVAPELPATTIRNYDYYCYTGMFSGCTSLTTAPELPATTLASDCYSNMFRGCTSLTTAPELPATTLASGCYGHMFDGCTSLTTAPNMPATSLASNCYSYMFTGCISLLLTPDLPATTLADGCYAYMFFGCTSLTTVPELPAINLPNPTSSWVRGCYQSMFEGCNSLTTAPELPATILTTRCYKDMFKNCSSLNEITCLATVISATDCTTDWLSGVASTGTFHKNPEMLDWLIDSPSGIPEGWTVQGNRYEVVATANPSEGGIITGAGMYDEGSQVNLTATPNEGYIFVNWTENGEVVSTDASYSFTVTSDRNLVANFTETSNTNHWTTITGTQYNLTMSGIIYIDGVAQTSTALEIGAFCGDECRGSARAQYFPPSNEYVVSLAVVSNQQSGETIIFRLYDHDTQQEFPSECVNSITFVANANFGEMGNWYPFAFNNSVAVTATVTPEGAGTVEGTGDYLLGTSCTLTATANTGYTFVNWTENGEVVSTNNPYTFTVNGAVELTANFSLNSYSITASSNPTTGGTIDGTGTYYHFSSCTLTATANMGYVFQSWSVAGEVVSTDNPYTFTVNSAAELTANFSLISYDITATSNPTTGGIIDGTGTYEHFSSCTLTAMANMGYAFRFWSVNGETVSTDNPYTFTVSEAVELTANFDAQETITLDNGWTWWSTSIEMSGIDGLTMLEESLGHNGLTIKSANKFVQNYYPNTGYDYWFGQLTSDDFNNESSYMIQTSTSCEVTMTGMYANPSDNPIQLYPNWTWIGYPCGIQQSAASAFAGFIPTHNDLLKGQYAFSTYYDNYGWFPEFSLTPGQGYMYQSLASGNRTLTFANGSKADPVPTNGEDRYWRNNVHAYADNMNVIAVVTVSGEEQHGEDIELGAFVNGECRGSAMLKHFQPTDRWYAMLTVTGADGDEIEFGVIDRNRGLANMTSDRSLVFQANTVVGELDEPYVIDFGTLGCIENGIEEPMHIYPNPIERNTRFTIALPETETLSDIFIVNMMGEVVAHETNKDKMTALQTPGVYTVKVVCHSGKVFVSKLVVR